MTVKIYAGVSPNVSGGTFYYFTAYADFVSALGTPVLSFENENYLYTADAFRVALPNAPQRLAELCYMIVEDDATGLFVAYHIMNAEYVSGFLTLTLSKDMWATYIYKAQIKYLRVERSTRALSSQYIYDEPGIVNPDPVILAPTQPGVEDVYYTTSDLCVIFCMISSNGTSSIFLNGASTRVQLWGLTLADYNAQSPSLQTTLQGLCTQISAIYSTKVGSESENPAGVSAIWIIPSAWIPESAKHKNYGGADPLSVNIAPTTRPGITVQPSFYLDPFTNEVNFQAVFPSNLTKKSIIYLAVGQTEWVRVPSIKNTAGRYFISIYIANLQNEIRIYARINDSLTDITDVFETIVTANDGNLTALQRVQKILKFSAGVSGAIVSAGTDIINQDIAGATVGGLGIAANVSEQFGKTAPRVSGSGSGAAVMFSVIATPFKYFVFEAAGGALSEYSRLGARFWNVFITSLSDLFNANLIEEITEEGEEAAGGAYLRATASIYGLPENARQYITERFAEGIHLKEITNETLNLFT